MIEIFPGSGVFWYVANKQCFQATTPNRTQLVSTMIDIIFSHEVLKISNLKEGGTIGKSYKKLAPAMISTIEYKLYYIITLHHELSNTTRLTEKLICGNQVFLLNRDLWRTPVIIAGDAD